MPPADRRCMFAVVRNEIQHLYLRKSMRFRNRKDKVPGHQVTEYLSIAVRRFTSDERMYSGPLPMKLSLKIITIALSLLACAVILVPLLSRHAGAVSQTSPSFPRVNRANDATSRNPPKADRNSDQEIVAELESVHVNEGEIAIVPVDLLVHGNTCKLVIAVGAKDPESARVASEKTWRSINRVGNNGVTLKTESGNFIEFGMFPLSDDEAVGGGRDERITIYPSPPPVRRIGSDGVTFWSIVEPEVYSKSSMNAGMYEIKLNILSSMLPGPQPPNAKIVFPDWHRVAAKHYMPSR